MASRLGQCLSESLAAHHLAHVPSQIAVKAEEIAEKALEGNGASVTDDAAAKVDDDDEVAMVDDDVAKEEEKLREVRRGCKLITACPRVLKALVFLSTTLKVYCFQDFGFKLTQSAPLQRGA